MRHVNNPAKFKILTLDDFRRQGFIGQWFGDLKLVTVAYQPGRRRYIEYVICQVQCAAGHMQSINWSRLRDKTARRDCISCGAPPPKRQGAGSMAAATIWRKVEALDPDRQRLFTYLMDSRKRVAGQEDTTPEELLRDTYEYCASPGLDAISELREWLSPPEPIRTYYGASSLNYGGHGFAEAD